MEDQCACCHGRCWLMALATEYWIVSDWTHWTALGRPQDFGARRCLSVRANHRLTLTLCSCRLTRLMGCRCGRVSRPQSQNPHRCAHKAGVLQMMFHHRRWVVLDRIVSMVTLPSELFQYRHGGRVHGPNHQTFHCFSHFQCGLQKPTVHKELKYHTSHSLFDHSKSWPLLKCHKCYLLVRSSSQRSPILPTRNGAKTSMSPYNALIAGSFLQISSRNSRPATVSVVRVALSSATDLSTLVPNGVPSPTMNPAMTTLLVLERQRIPCSTARNWRLPSHSVTVASAAANSTALMPSSTRTKGIKT